MRNIIKQFFSKRENNCEEKENMASRLEGSRFFLYPNFIFLARLEEIREIGLRMSERLRLQERSLEQRNSGLLKFAKVTRSNTITTRTNKGKKDNFMLLDLKKKGKLESFESGFFEDIEESSLRRSIRKCLTQLNFDHNLKPKRRKTVAPKTLFTLEI